MAESTSGAQPSIPIKPLATYSIDGKKYQVFHCTEEDIPAHAKRVSSLWTDATMQLDAMQVAIENKTAWKLTGTADVCFLYGIPDGRKELCGMSFWCRTRVHAVVGYMFIRDHTHIRRIFWNPHKLPDKTPLAFLLDDRTIADYHDGAEFISIKIPYTELEKLRREQLARHKFYEG